MKSVQHLWSGAGKAIAAGGILVAALGACRSEEVASAPLPPVVRISAASASTSSADLMLSGSLEADLSVAVSFKGMGTVQKVLVSEGQSVRQGQILAIQDAASLKDQLATAKAKARQAEDAYDRLEPMHKNGTIPEIKWVEVETGRDQARSLVSMARRNLEDAALHAPLSGIVAKRSVEPGEQAPLGLAAFTIVQTGTMLATVPVAEKEVTRLRPGIPARVRVDASGREYVGKIREIGIEADPLTRTYKVKVAIPNPGGELRVGMVADVRLHGTANAPTVTVPTAAVLVDASDRRFLWVESQGKVQRRTVRVAGFLKEAVAIDSGITAGENVVISGTPMLSDGAAVRVGK